MKIAIIIIIIIFVLSMILISLSGCSVVKTTELSKDKSTGNMYYYLPKGLLKITSTVKVYIYTNKTTNHLEKMDLISQSFNYENQIVPDNFQIFKLNYTNNPFSKDDVDIKINDKGLLTNLDVVSEDRLPNIIETITKAPTEILGVGGASKSLDPNLVVSIEEFTKVFLVDPSEFPKNQTWVIAKNDNFGNSIDKDVSFVINLENPTAIGHPTKIESSKEIKGILTRPMALYKFSITPSVTELGDYKIELYEYLPNNEFNIEIPLSRALFAKKTNNLVFSDGLIKENKISKPSEVEGFISIPINIAKAIVSIPGQIFTFKIDNTKKKTELEKEILNLEKAISDGERAKLIKDLETQKQKLEADKNLLSVEKDVSMLTNEINLLKETQILQNEKTILQLKKEIEALKIEIEKLKN